jgi:uncharacterized heparinase superfamily protein
MLERLGELLREAAFKADSLALRALAPLRRGIEKQIRAPQRLRAAPQDIRTGDATVATEIMSGYFSFEGKIVETGDASPFALAAPSLDWRRRIAGFSWLRHLRAEGSEDSFATARALVEDFAEAGRFGAGDPALEAGVTARRMLSFLSQAPMLLDRADAQFAAAFFELLGRDARTLARFLAWRGLRGAERLSCTLALLEFAICTGAESGLKSYALSAFVVELDRQILPDGGHASRNPQTLLDLLLDLLPLRQLHVARGVNPPPALPAAIARMIPMLRLLQHRDGELALFNGMGATDPGALAAVFAHEPPESARVDAPASGYARLAAGDANIIVDAGSPPPFEFSERAHAGASSFEFSLGAERVVVNCGAPPLRQTEAREAARATAAHSTLTLDDQSSSVIAPFSAKAASGRIAQAAKVTPARRRNIRMGEAIDVAHDGYVSRHALRHERILALARDGARLIGQDRLLAARSLTKPAAACPYALRFHLHPSVVARLRRDGFGVDLTLPSGARLVFEASQPAALEESVFFATPGGARATTQIVLSGEGGPATRLRWSFSKPSQAGEAAWAGEETDGGESGAGVRG